MTINNNETPSIALIGGMEITIENKPNGQLQFGNENPGDISVKCQGRVWNLALSLTAAGCKVDLASAAGNDFPGQSMKAQLEKRGVGVDGFYLVDGQNTGAEHVILNLLDQPEMEFENKEVFDHLTVDRLVGMKDRIASADCIVLDTSFPVETMEYVAQTFSQVPIFLWSDSPANAMKSQGILDRMACVLIGRRDGEILSGLEILSGDQLQTASQWFRDRGLRQVCFHLGNGAIYYNDDSGSGLAAPGTVDVADVVRGVASGKTMAELIK